MVQRRTDSFRTREIQQLRSIDRRRRTRRESQRLSALERNVEKQQRRQRTRERLKKTAERLGRRTRRISTRISTSRPETRQETIQRAVKEGSLKKNDKFTFDPQGNLILLRRQQGQTTRVRIDPVKDKGFLGDTSTFLKRVQTQIKGKQEEQRRVLKQSIKQARKEDSVNLAGAIAGTGLVTGAIARTGVGLLQIPVGLARFSEGLRRKANRDKAIKDFNKGKKFIQGLDRKKLVALAAIAGVSVKIYLKTRSKADMLADSLELSGTLIGFKGAGKVRLPKVLLAKRIAKVKPIIQRITIFKKPVSDTRRISKGKFKTTTDFGRAGKIETVSIRKGKSTISASKGTLKLGTIRVPKVVSKGVRRKKKVEFGKPKPLTVSIKGKSASIRIGKKKIVTFSTQTAKTNKQLVKLTARELKKANIISPALTKALARTPKAARRVLRKPTKKQPRAKKPILRREALITISQEIGRKKITKALKNLDLRKLTDKELKAKFGVTKAQAKALGIRLDRFSNPVNFFRAVQRSRKGIVSREVIVKALGKKRFLRPRKTKIRLDIAARGRTAPIKVGKITVKGAKETFSTQTVVNLRITETQKILKLLRLLGATSKAKTKSNIIKALKTRISKVKTKKDLNKLASDVQKLGVKINVRKVAPSPRKPTAVLKKKVKVREKRTTAQIAGSIASAQTQSQAISVVNAALAQGTISVTQTGFRLGLGRNIPLIPFPQGIRLSPTAISRGIVTTQVKAGIVQKIKARTGLKVKPKQRAVTKAKLKTKLGLRQALKPIIKAKAKPITAIKEGTVQQQRIIQKLKPRQRLLLRNAVASRLTQPFSPNQIFFFIKFGGFTFRFRVPSLLKRKKKKRVRGKKRTKKQVIERFKPSLAEELAGRTTTRRRGIVGLSPRTRVVKRKKPVKRRRKRVVRRKKRR